MLARLLQFVIWSLLAAAAAWLLVWWAWSPTVALSGCMLLLFGYSAVHLLGLVALRSLNRHDPAGPAQWGELFSAWWLETRSVAQVFFWRQPFHSNVVADFLPQNGRRGVVFIHGFVCNRGLWTPWMRTMRHHDHAFVAVNLEPVFGRIDDYVPIIEAAVQRVTAATGLAPILVCHSMGGLAARAWLRAAADAARVECIVTIGTPHHGAWLGQFSRVPNGAQMRLDSLWLQQLNREEFARPGGVRFTCWYSNSDNIVFPASSATLPGADNRLVVGAAHLGLAFRAEVMSATLNQIAAGNR